LIREGFKEFFVKKGDFGKYLYLNIDREIDHQQGCYGFGLPA
jgi:hypothetical protein